ncbi:uncharacterized protein N7459_005574 [Penicillium hispanicum]|uniref:uncharacterized protein n=1 Tax=Penicillium hispanicum TaxID=1080232 RepID=UPI002540F0BD|nr:uncharacterized protein N7459_005574 [Penicillium hispanicum]KAJ5579589.1 hypothetical protein N7459_005574 [Penicillium hispanicum]
MFRPGLLPYYISLAIFLFILFRKLPSITEAESTAQVAPAEHVYHGLLKSPPGAGDDSQVIPPQPEQLNSNPDLAQPSLGQIAQQQALRPGDIPAQPHDDSTLFDPEPSPPEPGGVIGSMRDIRYLLPPAPDGGLLTLTNQTSSPPSQPMIYDPYPDYNSPEWQRSWKGHFHACEGPRGRALDRLNPEDMMSVYIGTQEGFPRPKLGAFDAMGLDGQVCADRYSRYGVYGYGENHPDVEGFQKPSPVNWETVNWATLQAKCYSRNADRYALGRDNLRTVLGLPSGFSTQRERGDGHKSSSGGSSGAVQRHKARSALLIRVWHTMEWTPNLIHYIRSVIMELSLHSGGEYDVFILVHVKDDTPIHTDTTAAEKLKRMYVPAEFREMAILFNNHVLESWYPDVEEHDAQFQHLQPIQIFSELYPQFEYYWQLEVDARFTGHTYHFLDKAIEFAKQQPRKYLWERNAYHYMRDAHGPWDTFMRMVDELMVDLPSVWGPVSKEGVNPIGPEPPVNSPEEDDYIWGVGEEADVITFLPVFDPADTDWTYPDMMWNLDPANTPRRASVITMSRLSRRLLHEVHEAQSKKGWGIVSEMTASTFALWHGLKVVHVPHPVYIDGQWTPKELARIMNPGTPEKINGGPDSFWNYYQHTFEHIFFRISFMYSSQTAEDLFRRWMGYKVDPNQATDGHPHQDHYGRNWYDSGDLVCRCATHPDKLNVSFRANCICFQREDLYGRLCYPSTFLHTIKSAEEVKGPTPPIGI